MASRPITSWQIEMENVEAVTDFLFLGSKITVDGDWNHEIRRQLFLGKKAMTNLDSVLKSNSVTLPTKVHIVKATSLSNSHIRLRELDYKECRAPKNWHFRAVVLEKILESPLDHKKIKAVDLKGNQHWILIGRAAAEAPILWPPDVNSQFIGKDLDAGKDWMKKRAKEGWDGWMESLMKWIWTWANSRRWWGTGWPGLQQSMELWRNGHDLGSE